MAKVVNNIITRGLKGKVGNLVHRERNGKTTVYVLSPRKASFSKKQVAFQTDFKEAVYKTLTALSIEEDRKKLEEMAVKMKKESAYTAGISFHLAAIRKERKTKN